MQKPLLPVPTVKLSRLKGVGTGMRTETCVNFGGPITMVPYLHQGNIYIKRKLQVCRAQKCTSLVSAKGPFTCVGRQTTPTQGSRYRAGNGNLRKLGWTYQNGTIFAPMHYLYQKVKLPRLKGVGIGMRTETCVNWGRPIAMLPCFHQGNIYIKRKLQVWRENPEIYFSSRCKKPSYLCGPSNYPDSRESV